MSQWAVNVANGACYLDNGVDYPIACAIPEQAEGIARRLNAYEGLVAACAEALDYLEGTFMEFGPLPAKLKAALAAAGEGGGEHGA